MSATKHIKAGHALQDGVVRLWPVASTDAVLVVSLKAGEAGASELLFDRYGAYVERLIVRVVGVDPEVPDLIHEVFARALEGIRGLRESSALKGWIGSIALFTARAFLRNRRTRRRWLRFLAPHDLPETAATIVSPEVSETLKRTYAVLDALPTDERIAFALRFVEGMELANIAEMAGVSLATIKRRLVRAQELFWDAAGRDPLLREHIADDRTRNR
ncbi:MAG TPA: RNA polymerase sigma factor [Polyangiaceae bacterium]|nr:RNA polymerase sigma factor [Polyangiaceae bacterium]